MKTLLAVLSLLCWARSAGAAELQPYIDEIKRDMPASSAAGVKTGSTPFLDAQRKRILEEEPPPPEGSYLEAIRASGLAVPASPQSSYTAEQAARIRAEGQAADRPTSAIEAYRQGKNELKPNKSGKIRNAFGFRLGLGMNRNISAGSAGLQSYSAIYGDAWTPDLMGFYEWQPWHSEFWGNVGVVAGAGFAYSKGSGKFKFTLTNPVTNESFGADSKTDFRFVSAPVFIGLNYRFNLARWVRPFVQGAAAVIGYQETRNDGVGNHQGISKATILSGGANLPLDFLAPAESWDLYASGGIKNYYLTVEYSKTITLASDVNFDVSGLGLGFTYEF